eukprot:766015-Hanusia_phi.AAC.1
MRGRARLMEPRNKKARCSVQGVGWGSHRKYESLHPTPQLSKGTKGNSTRGQGEDNNKRSLTLAWQRRQCSECRISRGAGPRPPGRSLPGWQVLF